ncbi:hypothetical protein [Massilia endophytica]|uniref:hypothetical protein n=1 Tax=Massilia endophytica TaxID=2899220 RepID=UPI001E62C5A8|nr:hypothetical protein [Massilia endophytica]UGQ47855.1 hypothetical protein LSQ66_05135 [Massilia endophytica]
MTSNFIRMIILGLLATTIGSRASALDKNLPAGWRLPSTSELNAGWRPNRDERGAIANGDFNGDGFPDEAVLLLSLDGTKLGLFVFLSQRQKPFKIHQLANVDGSLLEVMGIAKVPAGTYHTACGKGYWECRKNEASTVPVDTDAIDYFKFESASSYFYWDRRKKTFRRVWISD